MDEIQNKALEEWFMRYPESKQLYDQLTMAQKIEFTTDVANTLEFQVIELRIAWENLILAVMPDFKKLLKWLKEKRRQK